MDDEIKTLLNRIEWGLAVTSLEFTMKAYREYDYGAIFPNDPAHAYELRTSQIERARAAKNDIAALARIVKANNE